MALLYGAKQILGKMAAVATTVRTDRQPSRSAEVEILTPARPLQAIRLNAAFAPLVSPVPPSCLETPSMMSIAERQFLFGLASRYYAGKGIIVDAGTFLGASTRCFGEGVRSNPHWQGIMGNWPRPIVSYERAIVTPNMPVFFKRHGLAFSAAQGESFESELRRNIAPVEDVVDLRIGDFMDATDIDCPVEILFLDILKTPGLSLRAFRLFHSKLIPGRSLVVHQDYFFEELPWIKTHQEALAAYFEFVGEIGSSAVFLCTKQVPQSVLDGLENEVPPAEQLRLASIAMQRSVDPARRFFMALSKVRLIRKLQGRVAARAYFELVKAEFPEQVAHTDSRRLSDALRRAEEFLVKKPRKVRKDAIPQPSSTFCPPSRMGSMTKRLSADEVSRYRRDGFHFPIRVLSPAQARACRDRLEAHERATGGPIAGDMRHKVHLLFTWANELARHPAILDAVEDVIGPDILCWSSTFFIKEARSPSFVSWHQDATYWGLSTDEVITAWVAFADAPVESGAMRFWPGSHLRNQLEHRDTFDENNLLSRGQEIAVDVPDGAGVDVPLKAGEMSLHHVLLAHASGPNTTDDRRIGLALRYIPPHVRQLKVRDSATLVRGRDPYGNFDPEPAPKADLDAEALASHRQAVERSAKALYSGTDRTTFRA